MTFCQGVIPTSCQGGAPELEWPCRYVDTAQALRCIYRGQGPGLNQLPTGRTGTDPTHCGTTVTHPPHAVIQRPHWGGGKADWAGGHAGGWGPWGSNSWRASAVPHRENVMGPLRARRKACTAGRSDTMSSVTPWTQRGVDIWFSPQQPLVYPVAKRCSLTREPHGHARLHGNP